MPKWLVIWLPINDCWWLLIVVIVLMLKTIHVIGVR